MGTTADKLQYLVDAKSAISAAIVSKGGTVPTELSGYGPAIEALPSGGTPKLTTIAYSKDGVVNTIAVNMNDYAYTPGIIDRNWFENLVTDLEIDIVRSDVLSCSFGDEVFAIDPYAMAQLSSMVYCDMGSVFLLNVIASSTYEPRIDQISSGALSVSNQAFTFQHCDSMTSIAVSPCLYALPKRTFSDCGALQEISIPKSVQFIDNFAFRQCNSLMKYDFSQFPTTTMPPALGAGTGMSRALQINTGTKIVIPDDWDVSTWAAGQGWSQYSDYLVHNSDL